MSKEIACDFIKAVMDFGLYGELPDDESDVWLYGFDGVITSISAAKGRYEKARANGKKGGRPTISLDEAEVMKMKEELKTWKAVAAELGIDEDTLRRQRKIWNEKAEKPKNLNDNVNVNVNVNVNDNTLPSFADAKGEEEDFDNWIP